LAEQSGGVNPDRQILRAPSFRVFRDSGRSVGVVPTRPHVLNLSGRLGPSDAISLRLSTCQMLDVETTSGLRAGATVP
jgi:hypothetical protein